MKSNENATWRLPSLVMFIQARKESEKESEKKKPKKRVAVRLGSPFICGCFQVTGEKKRLAHIAGGESNKQAEVSCVHKGCKVCALFPLPLPAPLHQGFYFCKQQKKNKKKRELRHNQRQEVRLLSPLETVGRRRGVAIRKGQREVRKTERHETTPSHLGSISAAAPSD